ncbi:MULTISPECIES: helix-turn-helix domain-containing protein [Lacrimispora]|jgi:AraC-like DNA-binding protein|uniref:helix-turn-helix domain-containing protein n=1 Tax=Lacrimispora TaxID=2719231 RepID=UPI00047BE4F7|nr:MULTISPECIES: AraC family transcriptional regulator [Lacrimispora]
MEHYLQLKAVLPVKALNAGYLVTGGNGRHADRVMDSFEIIYVNSGVLGIAEEEIAYNVEEGEALILFPGRHHWGTREFDEDLTFYWLHFHLEEEAVRTGRDVMSLPQLIRVRKPEQFEDLFRRFIKRQNVCRDDKTILNLVLLELLCELSDSLSPMEVNGQKVLLANQAGQYIRNHLEEPLSSSILAEKLDCSPDYLGRVYNAVYGKTLTEGIHEVRLNKACRMLVETSLTGNEIAYQCGYQDVDYFRRIFKKYMGITPKEYRQTYSLVGRK